MLSKHFFFEYVLFYVPHLAKRLSDLKQKGTQEKTTFSSTVFHALSHGVVCFVADGSSKNHLLTGWDFLTPNQTLLFSQWFLKLPLATKWKTSCERVWKTVPENGVYSCVPFCLRSLGPFEKSVYKIGDHRNIFVADLNG